VVIVIVEARAELAAAQMQAAPSAVRMMSFAFMALS
jgi:hypothetical protein